MKVTKRLLYGIIAIITVLTAFSGCTEKENTSSETKSSSSVSESRSDGIDTSIPTEDMNSEYDRTNAVSVKFSDGKAETNGEGAVSDGQNITIKKAGTYILSGTADNGKITVDADKNAEITLVLNGLELTCTDNSPVYVIKAKKVNLILDDGTENTITDTKNYSSDESGSDTDGCIFSKADLTVNGNGKLKVTANYKHGIVSKDNLTINGGNIEITSVSTAMEGKDSVKISGGNFNISSGTNGIKSTNTEDESKGFISISGGTFKIVSDNDAIESENALVIENGNFDIKTGGGSANASMKADGKPNEKWQNDMNNGGGGPGGNMNGKGTPPDMPGNNQGNFQNTSATSSVSDNENSTSAKALKSGNDIKISGGEFTIDSADDSVHSGGNTDITGGNFKISSGDDGIHSDKNLTVSGGKINIEKSYEGIEGLVVTINDGTISVTASDDGINCAGGSDTGSADRPGADQFSAQDGVSLNINGGTITVNAEGDGLDSNGDFTLSGGTVYVNGPTNNGNGALDYNGNAKVTGGTIIACGSGGMAEGFGESSTQYSVCHNLSSSVNANEKVTITDKNGREILSYTPSKSWQNIVFSSADMKQGETYTITAGTVSETVTLNGIATSNSSAGNNGFGRGRK